MEPFTSFGQLPIMLNADKLEDTPGISRVGIYWPTIALVFLMVVLKNKLDLCGGTTVSEQRIMVIERK